MDESRRLQMRRAHTNHVHTCVCGKKVRGNGGWASHRWACPKYQDHLEDHIRRVGYVPVKDENVRRAPKWARFDGKWVEMSEPMKVPAGEVEIGDVLEGNGERVTGWFLDAKNGMVLEHGGRNHRYLRSEPLLVRRRVDAL